MDVSKNYTQTTWYLKIKKSEKKIYCLIDKLKFLYIFKNFNLKLKCQ